MVMTELPVSKGRVGLVQLVLDVGHLRCSVNFTRKIAVSSLLGIRPVVLTVDRGRIVVSIGLSAWLEVGVD